MGFTELEKKLKKLDDELDEYSFNIRQLDDKEKQEIRDLYKLLWKTYNHKIFIENLENINVRVTDKIYTGNELYIDQEINEKTTLHFINCKNIRIIINGKVCHITLERCENLNLKTRGGAITGLDDINCKNINHVLENSSVYFLDVSNSEGCVFYISENNAPDTMISSYGSPDIKIITTCPTKGIIKNKFIPILSFFEIYRLYSFEKSSNGLIELFYVTSTYTPNKRKVINQTWI